MRVQIGDRTVSRIYEICGNPMPMMGDDHRVPQHMRVEGPVVDEDRGWQPLPGYWVYHYSPALHQIGNP